MNYIIFGASNFGKDVYREINKDYEVIAFSDNDNKKWGEEIEGKKIISPEELLKYNAKVIVASMYHIEIVMQLISYGIFEFYVYSDLNSDEHGLIYYNYTGRDMSEKSNRITFIKDNNSGSNTFTLYKYLKQCDEFEVALVNEKYGKDKEYYYNIITSKIIIKSHEGSYINGKINIQLWHGIPLKTLGYMNKFERVDCEKRHNIWNKSIIVSYSQMYNVLMGACYGVSFKNFIITGLPRNDLLLKSSGRENLQKIINIGEKKIVFYMPTYRKSSYGEVNGCEEGYLFSEKNINKLDEYLEKNNMVMLAKMHPFEEENFELYFKENNFKNIVLFKEEYLNLNNIDLYEILNSCDYLLTDYSSVYFDYLLLDKPILFFNKDVEEYEKSTGFLLEPYDYWTPGPKCCNIQSVIEELEKINSGKDEYKEKRNELKKIFHKYSDSNSCERIVEMILKLLKDNEEKK